MFRQVHPTKEGEETKGRGKPLIANIIPNQCNSSSFFTTILLEQDSFHNVCSTPTYKLQQSVGRKVAIFFNSECVDTLTVEKKGIFSFYDVGPTKISSKRPKSWLFWAFQTHTNIPIPNCQSFTPFQHVLKWSPI